MPYVSFISDDEFLSHVSKVLKKGQNANEEADKKFYSNVIDPFGPIFEVGIRDISTEQWMEFEKTRQFQKTLQNAIGDFHNDILGSVDGWTKLEKGEQIDLIKDDYSIIAEVKNKYNTVTGSKLVDHYKEFDNLVNKKASKYKGATAYFVQIIPKNPIAYNKPFVPSDKESGKQEPLDENIRVIDGHSFYELVTNRADALQELQSAIPKAIMALSNEARRFDENDLGSFQEFFERAYLED